MVVCVSHLSSTEFGGDNNASKKKNSNNQVLNICV